MLLPAWDFDVDAWQHSRVAVMRGIENGFSTVRPAANGNLTVSDPNGFARVAALLPQTRRVHHPKRTGACVTALDKNAIESLLVELSPTRAVHSK